MVYLNEWLPNPSGIDTGAEWIEIFNNGKENVSLNGWSLVNGSGKKFIFKNHSVDSGEYLVLKQIETKLTLKNSNESLSLYDSQNKLIDKSSFSGSAPDGKSLARQSLGDGGFSRTGDAAEQGPAFIFTPTPERESLTMGVAGANSRLVWGFTPPTPGAQNKIVKEFLAAQTYPLNQPLNKTFGTLDTIGLALFVGLLYPVLIIAIFKKNDYLSKLFFGRD